MVIFLVVLIINLGGSMMSNRFFFWSLVLVFIVGMLGSLFLSWLFTGVVGWLMIR